MSDPSSQNAGLHIAIYEYRSTSQHLFNQDLKQQGAHGHGAHRQVLKCRVLAGSSQVACSGHISHKPCDTYKKGAQDTILTSRMLMDGVLMWGLLSDQGDHELGAHRQGAEGVGCPQAGAQR